MTPPIRRSRAATLVALALASSLLAAACTRGARDGRAARGGLVTGTVLDASTGERVAGVRVEGPDGASARSDADGRFRLAGLPRGVEGDVVARDDDGRSATIRLRPLGDEPLEVVLQLR